MTMDDSGLDWDQINFTVAGSAPLPTSLLGISQGLTPTDITTNFSQEADFTSHELQFMTNYDSSLNFTSGLYYYHSDESQKQDFVENNPELMEVYATIAVTLAPPAGPLPVNADGDLYRGTSQLDTTSYAVYGQADWEWTDQTTITLGLRYSYDEKEGEDTTFAQYVAEDVSDPGFIGDPAAPDNIVERKIKDDWNKVTWRLGIDHILTEDHFVYAFAASGYRSGGFNLMQPTANTDVGSVDPEDLLSFEVGYRSNYR